MLLCREVRKERPLYALPLGFHQFGIVLPPHVFHKVFCRCDECSAIAAYQVVASLAVHIAYASRKGKDIAVVSLRYFGGDQSSTLGGTLHEDTGIRHARHNTVAPYEVDFISIGLGKQLREQSALTQHFHSRSTMARRIKVVQTMSQHTHCLISIVQSLLMGMNVDAISQATHNKDLRA